MAATRKSIFATSVVTLLLSVGLYFLIDRLVYRFDLLVAYGPGTHGSKPYVYFFGFTLPFDYYYRIWRTWQISLGFFSIAASFISVAFLKRRLNA
jgi:hypothetical protein